MHHIAIMNKQWRLIPKLVSGEKTIESRWYKNRIAPWNRINSGDTVYFKDSGEKVTAVADVTRVKQYSGLNQKTFSEIVENYADKICLQTREYSDYYRSKNYCILIFLKHAKFLEQPFNIDKSGYGSASAWMCLEDVELIKVRD